MSPPAHALPVAAALLAALSGCGTSRTSVDHESDSSPPAVEAVDAPAIPTRPTQAPPQFEDGARLTVAQVVALAIQHDPRAAVHRADQRLAMAHITQARAWSNPEAEVELGRSVTLDDQKTGIGRFSIRQRLEWPGKRSARIDAAEAGGAVTASERQRALLDVAGEASATALDVALDQQGREQARTVQALAGEVVAAIARRVDAGEASRADLLRARVEALQADQALAGIESDLAAAQAALAALCGDALPDHYAIAPAVAQDVPATLAEALTLATRRHPEALRLTTLLDQRRLEVERERAAAYPDLTVGLFAGRETDSRDLGVSLGVELPVWDRNQGGIAAAQAECARSAAELAVQAITLRREVEAAWRAHERARDQAGRYADTLRPAAQEALRLALGSYQAGETSVLDLLDARRTAQAIDTATLDAQRQVHAAHIRLDLAMGTLPGNAP